VSSYVSVGYLQPQAGRVIPGELQFAAGGHQPDGGRMPDWHYLSDVSVEWPLSVDLPRIKQDCQLPDDAQVGVVLSWRSDRTNLRGSIPAVPALDGENLLRAVILGSTLGGTLTMEVALVLRRPGTAISLLAPSRSGSLLWSTSEQLVLEGSGGRFPTISADFAAEGIAGDGIGLWYLDISDSDLQANCTSAVTLYINSANPSIQDVLIAGSARNSQLVKFMMYDVYRQLMMVAMRNDEFDDRLKYDRGSLGDALVTLLRMYFPGKDIGQLRRNFELSAPNVEAELLARVVWRLQQ
jgi:hypothetical protein